MGNGCSIDVIPDGRQSAGIMDVCTDTKNGWGNVWMVRQPGSEIKMDWTHKSVGPAAEK